MSMGTVEDGQIIGPVYLDHAYRDVQDKDYSHNHPCPVSDLPPLVYDRLLEGLECVLQ